MEYELLGTVQFDRDGHTGHPFADGSGAEQLFASNFHREFDVAAAAGSLLVAIDTDNSLERLSGAR